MNYEQMSDFEINKAVAQHVGLSTDNGYGFIDTDGCVVCYDIIAPIGEEPYAVEVRVNYCNNPSDAWPVIFENKISLVAPENGIDTWEVISGEHLVSTKTTPLRAAMIVFLMMKDAEK